MLFASSVLTEVGLAVVFDEEADAVLAVLLPVAFVVGAVYPVEAAEAVLQTVDEVAFELVPVCPSLLPMTILLPCHPHPLIRL